MAGRWRILYVAAACLDAVRAVAGAGAKPRDRSGRRCRSQPTSGLPAMTATPAWSWTSPRPSGSAPSRSPIPIAWSSIFPRPCSSCRPNPAKAGRGLIKAYRYGLVMAGGSRIVIDVAKAGADRKGEPCWKPATANRRGWCSICRATDREAFLRHLALDRPAARPAFGGPVARRGRRTSGPAIRVR